METKTLRSLLPNLPAAMLEEIGFDAARRCARHAADAFDYARMSATSRDAHYAADWAASEARAAVRFARIATSLYAAATSYEPESWAASRIADLFEAQGRIAVRA